MADLNEQSWKLAQRAEKELQATLAEKDPTFRIIDHQIDQYRAKCESLMLQDFNFALGKDVENRLWNAHIRINSRFRKQLSTFRKGLGKKKLVEHRKVMKHYLDFIKSSQRFYRGYIQRLDSQFNGIMELRAVARRLNLNTSFTDSQFTASENLRHKVLVSCHQTLVRLGDLSRYRESEPVGKEHNWGPAIGYYVLAEAIYPASGASQNQLAVIARTDANHLRATYHLYRALTVEEPHPAARGNLELEFKKIHEAWNKGEIISNGLQRDGEGPGKALVGWFMRLHASCYNGVEFVEHDELEDEVLTQLAVDLKERSLEGTLNKFILINIAAEYFALVRMSDSPESEAIKQSVHFFLQLNIRTFSTLLQVLQPELERFAGEEAVSGADGLLSNGSGKTTTVARRILPGLRHYSSWLTIHAKQFNTGAGIDSLNVQIKEMWKSYANTLTLLASTFPVDALPEIKYLLEEDEDTLGFKPLEHESTLRRYYSQESGMRKPKYHDHGIERYHSNKEMLGRIRDLLLDGLELQLQEDNPIKLVEGATFAYFEEGLTEFIGSPECHQATISSAGMEHEEISYVNEIVPPNAACAFGEGVSEAASVSVSTNTHRWIDNLVGSETADNDICREGPRNEFADRIPPTPPDYSFDGSPTKEAGNDTSYGVIGTLTARDLVQGLRSYSPQGHHQSTPQPTLPSILNSPFAPQPGEATPHSRPSTAKYMPTHSPRNSQNGSSMPQQFQQTDYSIDSNISSIQPDRNGATFQLPQNHKPFGNFGVIARPSAVSKHHGSKAMVDDTAFHSSSVFQGSPWEETPFLRGREGMAVQTPPNGQGGG